MPSCTFCDQENPRGATRCSNCGAELPGAMENEVSPAGGAATNANDVLSDLIRRGQKIEAIKLFREQTGVGLAEAKAAVEALERGETLVPPPTRPQSISDEEVVTALENGGKIGAIKLYRERTGVGLKEAKDAVEALAARHGIVPKSGCASMVIIGALTGWTLWNLIT